MSITQTPGTRSRVWSDVDLDGPGKQAGYLQVPWSVTRSAYGNISIPVVVIKGGDGPTALLMGGVHGDEYEAQIALSRIARELEPEHLQGRAIILPSTNLPAALAGTRVSPIDQVNLNRCFPGDPDGTPTPQIAFYIDAELLPRTDVWLDLHSGGGSLAYLPFASNHAMPNAGQNARSLAALEAFGAPVSVIWSFFDEPRMAAGCAARHGVTYIGSELGGAASVSPEGVRLGYEGSLRVLRHAGILKATAPVDVPEAPPIRLMEASNRAFYAYAPEPGVFEPACALGDTVEPGARIGLLHFVDRPMREPVPVHVEGGGLVVCLRHPGLTDRGDCLCHLAFDRPPGPIGA